MKVDKEKILKNHCYTKLVYERINKKLKTNYSKKESEQLIEKVLSETALNDFVKRGKNFYVSNTKYNIRVTINSFTYRVITVDKI